jgi:hypothetical protein
MQNVTVDDNYHTRLDLRLGAPLEDVEEAFVRLDSEARAAGNVERSDELAEAHRGLTQPSIRSYHDQQIRWAAAGDWYQAWFPNGKSIEEHWLWNEYRRLVIEEEPSLWERIENLFEETE